MKRIAALSLALALTLGLTACGGGNAGTAEPPAANSTTPAAETTAPQAEPVEVVVFAAASLAADFTARCAERTAAQNYPTREGVDFEPLLWRLGAEFAEKAGTIPAYTEREERP